MHGATVSLAEVAAGEKVRIRTILFELLRQECEGVGLRAGQLVQVLPRSPESVRVALGPGAAVALRRQWAPFIEVEHFSS